MASSLAAELLASAARTTSGDAIALVQGLDRYWRGTVLLDVTAAQTLVGDTLNVYVQKNVGLEDAPVWDDFIHFTQVVGNGGAVRHVAEISQDVAPTTAMHAVADATLAVGAQQARWSNRWRIKWVVVGTGSFTFRVVAALSGPD